MKYFLLILIAFGVWKFIQRAPDQAQPFPRSAIRASTGVQQVPVEERQRVILVTGTTWCGACKHLDSTVISRPEWQAFVENEIQFMSIDVPGDPSARDANAQRIIDQYGIRSYPTMFIIDKDNEKIDEVVGAGAPVENYKKWIRQHAVAAKKA